MRIIGKFALATGLLAFALLAGCGGAGSGGGTTQRGPASAAAFVGTTITVNPTLRFLAGGSVEYTNTETGSPFPPSTTAITGTYTYTPSSDFTTGTLNLQLPGAITIALTTSGFQATNDSISSFRATYNGTPYVATVTAGTLRAAATPDTGNPVTGEVPATAIPASLRGSYDMTFDQTLTGSGIADGSDQTFTVGENTLGFGTKTLGTPVFRNGNTNEWIFKDGSIEYALSRTTAGGVNEINVTGAAGTPFYGTYELEGTDDGTITLLPNGNLPAGTTFTLGRTTR